MQRQKLTLMFTDIVGYSRLMGQNEQQTIQLVEHYRRILLACIERHQGAVIEFIGDAVFASFDQAQAAVDAAIDIQTALFEFNQNAEKEAQILGGPKLRTRIGLHSGEVTMKEGAPFGDDVNIAARLEPLAFADGVCISQSVYEAIKLDPSVKLKYLGKQSLKNIEHKIAVYLIRPEGITARVHAHYAWKRTQETINKYRYAIACCFLCLIVAGFYFIPRWLVPGYTANYVEIADFKNLTSENGEADYFSAGITEALRSQLADMEDVYIVNPEDGVRGPVRLEGSVQRAGENLRIAYRLFRRKDNVQIAGGKLDGVYDDIFILQDRVVAEIAQFVSKEFDLKYFRPAAMEVTSDVTAYDYYLKGVEYLQMPETHEVFDFAIKFFSTALVHDDKFSMANSGICRAYRGKYKLTQNIKMLEKAKQYCSAALAIGDSSSNGLIGLGLVFSDMGESDRAAVYFNQALSRDSKNIEALSALAAEYEKSGKYQLAEELLLSVNQAMPDYWAAYVEYSYLLIGQGRLDEAENVLNIALRITPENEPVLSNMGAVYLYSGAHKEAAKMFELAAEIVPSSVVYSNAGTGHYYARNFQKSYDAFVKAIKLAPEDFRFYVNAADVLRYVPGKREEVVELARKAISMIEKKTKTYPNYTGYEHFRAVAHYLLGENKLAGEQLEIAIAERPRDIEVLYTAMRLQTLLGDKDEAINSFGKLVELRYPVTLVLSDPDFDSLQSEEKFKQVVNVVFN
ncbi:MAG: tetratricopeptide repeat protein [Agarilytica sp.]